MTAGTSTPSPEGAVPVPPGAPRPEQGPPVAVSRRLPTVVRVTVPIRYEEDKADLLGMPGVSADTLDLLISMDDGRIIGWPPDAKAYSVHTKVCDEGRYELRSTTGEVLALAEQEYVPDWFPDDHYGDYLILQVGRDGIIGNWPTDNRFADRVQKWVNTIHAGEDR